MATQTLTTTFDISELRSIISECISEALYQLTPDPSPQSSSEKQIFTRQETAEMLNITLPTLSDYTKRGIIKGCRFGAMVRYRKEDIDAALVAMKTSVK